MKISVIVPVFNVEPYISRCIDSILAQSYDNLEIILVDDGSTDGSGRICDIYAVKDERIKVIHKNNGGASIARKVGLESSSGEYISFIDSDDWIDNEMYMQMLNLAVQHDADIVECGYRWIKPDVVYDRCNSGSVKEYTNLSALNMLYFGDQMFGGLSIVLWNKLYRKSIFDNVHFPDGYIYEDVYITPQLFYYANKTVKLNKNLYNFFFSPSSVTRSPYSMKNLDVIEMRQATANFFCENGLTNFRDYMESSYLDSIIYNYCECSFRKSTDQYKNKLMSLLERFRIDYRKEIKLNNSLVCRNRRYKLFYTFPTLYCFLRHVKRRIFVN